MWDEGYYKICLRSFAESRVAFTSCIKPLENRLHYYAMQMQQLLKLGWS